MATRRCRPWAHQWLLRLDDWRVECTVCDAVKIERRIRPVHAGRVLIDPTIEEKHMSNVLQVAARVSKALAAAVGAGVAAYTGGQVAGNVDGYGWLTVAAAVLGAFLLAYNAPKNAET